MKQSNNKPKRRLKPGGGAWQGALRTNEEAVALAKKIAYPGAVKMAELEERCCALPKEWEGIPDDLVAIGRLIRAQRLIDGLAEGLKQHGI